VLRWICFFAGYSLQPIQKNLFGNPNWYMEWLSMFDHQYPAWCFDLRTPNPLSVAIPPPVERDMGMNMMIKQFDCVGCLLHGQRMVKRYLRVKIFEPLTLVLQSNKVGGFAWIWLNIGFCE
jgi:hypothetical protein